MALKSFTTGARNAADEPEAVLGEDIDVEIDGRTVTFHAPTSGQIAVTVAGSTDMATDVEMAGAQINFFFSLLDRPDHIYFKKRLFDREDSFDVDVIGEVVEYLMEQWSARPTKQPSDYLPSQSNGGKRSTRGQHRTTRSS